MKKFGDKVEVGFVKEDRVRINVGRENVHEVAEFIRDGLNYDHVESVSGVDYPQDNEIEVVYHIGSYSESSLARQILVLATRAQEKQIQFLEMMQQNFQLLEIYFTVLNFMKEKSLKCLGHSTMFMWPAGDRELLIDLMEKMTGARVTHAHFVPGGVRNDLPPNFEDVCLRQVNYFEKRIKEYAAVFYDNPILISRTRDTGVLSRQDAIRYGTTGSVLRASGKSAQSSGKSNRLLSG